MKLFTLESLLFFNRKWIPMFKGYETIFSLNWAITKFILLLQDKFLSDIQRVYSNSIQSTFCLI